MGSLGGPGLGNDRPWHVLKQDWALSGKTETGRAAEAATKPRPGEGGTKQGGIRMVKLEE